MEQLEELLHQFRRTPQTVSTLDSTHHAVVRSCISEGRSDNLMRMLDDPLNFGLFPDNYSLVFMLNHFLLAENWRDATKAIFCRFRSRRLSVFNSSSFVSLRRWGSS